MAEYTDWRMLNGFDNWLTREGDSGDDDTLEAQYDYLLQQAAEMLEHRTWPTPAQCYKVTKLIADIKALRAKAQYTAEHKDDPMGWGMLPRVQRVAMEEE